MPSTAAEKRASINYNQKMVERVHLAFNKKTDADILEFLATCPNKQGLIKDLIRREIAAQQKDPSD